MVLDDIIDFVADGISYVISGEFLGDFWEALTGVFDSIGDFSIIGLVFGIIGAGVIYYLKDYMLTPFLMHMSPISSIFWGGVTYAGCFAAGYLMGKHFEET